MKTVTRLMISSLFPIAMSCASSVSDVPPDTDGDGPDGSGTATATSDDIDGDGLTNDQEAALGTDPMSADSDADFLTDAAEVGDPSSPTDSDGDGLIDALESNRADNDFDGTPDQADPDGGWQLTAARFTPFAVVTGGSTSTTLEVRITGGDVTAVSAHKSTQPGGPFQPNPLQLAVDGEPAGTAIVLFDDGTHGDRIAGDGLWSRGSITSDLDTPVLGGRINGHKLDAVSVTLADGGTAHRHIWEGVEAGHPVFVGGSIVLGIVAPEAVETPQPYGAGAQATTHAINLIRSGLQARVQSFLATDEPLYDVTQAIYEVVGDDYDFLYLTTTAGTLGGVEGRSVGVANSTEGIGRELFDHRDQYGVGSRLQQIVALEFDPLGPMLHETAHRWGVFLSPEFGFDDRHWGAAGTFGQLGGFAPGSLKELEAGQWNVAPFGRTGNGGDRVPYSPIELYLMGLASEDEVDPIPVLDDAEITGANAGGLVVTAKAVNTVTINDIVAAHGPRLPAVGDSQTAFKAAFACVSDQLLTPAEMAYVAARGAFLQGAKGDGVLLSFEQATGGRATLDATIESAP